MNAQRFDFTYKNRSSLAKSVKTNQFRIVLYRHTRRIDVVCIINIL